MPLVFQRGAARSLDLTIHFRFFGRETGEATVVIRDQKLVVQEGLAGEASLTVTVDSDTWLGILAGEKSPVWAVLRRKLRVKGPLSGLKALQRCFP